MSAVPEQNNFELPYLTTVIHCEVKTGTKKNNIFISLAPFRIH